MLDTREQICALCNSKAKFYFVDHGDKKYFDCTNCKRYLICIDAEHYISEATEEIRINTARYAQESADDEATVISIESVTPYKHVAAKYAKRAELNV